MNESSNEERAPRTARNRGFTILEIMIATAILTLGLVGILALFPVAINTGKQVVETTTAAVIAESVADAIRQGLRNKVRYVNRGGIMHSYFILSHDGVQDPIPSRKELEQPSKDYYILLPRFEPGSRGTFASPDVALARAKTFLYPETDPVPNGNGDAFLSDDDGDDQQTTLSDGSTYNDVRVEKTYKIGRFLPDESTPAAENVLDDQKIEALKQYSYAFTMQASRADVDLSPSRSTFEPGNRLFRVRVMVFRGFMVPGPDSKPPDPEFELDFEVST